VGEGPSFWRYVPPNAVTAASLILGLLAIESAVGGRPIDAAWWGLLVTLTDKLDGFLANWLKATSQFGVQLDSLADLLAFGVVPSTIFYAYFTAHPQYGWADGIGALGLRAICGVYVVAVAIRLARFNVMAAKGQQKHYTGTPSTMTAGMLISFFLFTLKYASPAASAPEKLDNWHLFGALRTDALIPWLPVTLLLGGAGMLSPLRVPKLGRTFHPAATALLLAAVFFGYSMGIIRRLPEYLVGGGLYYLGICIAYHLRTKPARD
jgi:CDP-diacylglycerol--serine O-phosphatidyltransferase